MKTIVKFDPRLTIDDLEDVLQLPVVIRVNDFDDKDVEDFEEDISEAHQTGQPIIPILIDSYGGSGYGLLSMLSAIDHSDLPVATIVTGKAMSAGAMLFAYGDEGYRFMDPNAFLMFHDVYDEPSGKVEDLKADVRHLELMNERVYKRVSKHLGHDESYLYNLIEQKKHVDLYLDATEAQKHRIANHLYVPKFEIALKLEMKLR